MWWPRRLRAPCRRPQTPPTAAAAADPPCLPPLPRRPVEMQPSRLIMLLYTRKAVASLSLESCLEATAYRLSPSPAAQHTRTCAAVLCALEVLTAHATNLVKPLLRVCRARASSSLRFHQPAGTEGRRRTQMLSRQQGGAHLLACLGTFACRRRPSGYPVS